MRIIATSTLNAYAEKYPSAKESLRAWKQVCEERSWQSHQELKAAIPSASIIKGKRVVFNIAGNSFRLVADVEYRFQIVYFIWFGPHKDYDKLDVSNLTYKPPL